MGCSSSKQVHPSLVAPAEAATATGNQPLLPSYDEVGLEVLEQQDLAKVSDRSSFAISYLISGRRSDAALVQIYWLPCTAPAPH
jgi:hypothetical protein